MHYTDYFKNKKITVMGLGLLGRGVGDVEFLARHGADLIVTDLKTEEELAVSIERLRGFPNIRFILGEHRLEDFRDRDMILKAAGVPLDSIYINEAHINDIPIEMSTALFADLSEAKIVGITGTRGKSTVTQMIYDSLVEEKKMGNIAVNIWLGGNVRGVSTLALLDQVAPGDIAVLELDSWQLQGFRERKISPHISVFTTFMPDHMNYYKDDLKSYFFDKAAIYENQKEGDLLVMSDIALNFAREFELEPKSERLQVITKEDLSELPELSIPGEHNRMSACLALRALGALGVRRDNAVKNLVAFKGVAGRLEMIAEKDGVVFYNDTAATTPEAGAVAIKALKNKYNITLIAGGSDKGLDFSPFIKEMVLGVSNLVLLPGVGTDRLLQDLRGTKFEKAEVVSSMEEAVGLAVSVTTRDGAIVLSPGCASFGLFKNEFDRGDQFVRAVERL